MCFFNFLTVECLAFAGVAGRSLAAVSSGGGSAARGGGWGWVVVFFLIDADAVFLFIAANPCFVAMSSWPWGLYGGSTRSAMGISPVKCACRWQPVMFS